MGSSAGSITASDATGATGSSDATEATGSSDATGATGSSDATSSTGNSDVIGRGIKITGSAIRTPLSMPGHSKEMKDDEFVLRIKMPTQDTGAKHGFITAQEAVAKSEEKL